MDVSVRQKLTLDGKCTRCGNPFHRSFPGFSELLDYARGMQSLPLLCDECASTELVP